MAKSMTGFGRYEAVTEEYKFTVEIKSVNHRYLDLSVKLPKKLNRFEQIIRESIKKNIDRGKVDVYIGYEDYAEAQLSVRYHSQIVSGYIESIRSMAKEFGIETGNLNACFLAKFPEVLSIEENSPYEEQMGLLLAQAVEAALKPFIETRISEGEALKKDILKKLDTISDYVDYVESRSPEILQEYRTKLTDKVTELLGDKKLDEGVLATELTIYADKVCVDEETVRLRSHIRNMKSTLEKDEPIGRKLDFITQEMNREANTILSKANDMDLSNKAIDLKTEIEKIREQIQNIE